MRSSRRPLCGFLRMRISVNAIQDCPHGEERRRRVSKHARRSRNHPPQPYNTRPKAARDRGRRAVRASTLVAPAPPPRSQQLVVAGPPQKRQSSALRSPALIGSISFSVGRQMWLLLMLFWCSAGVRQCGGPDILRYNSRFGAFNSGLCWREFAIRGIAGIWRQWLDLVRTVGGRTVIAKDKALKCLSRWEKPGSSAGTDRGR